MIDTEYLQVSDGTGEAVKATVQAPGRAISATTIPIDTVAKWSAKYLVTTGTVLPSGFIDPATMTIMRGRTVGSTIVIDGFEPGYTDIGNTAGQVCVLKPNTGETRRIVTALETLDTEVRVRSSESSADYIASGGIWSILAGLNGAMTLIAGYQAGYRGTVAAIATRAFTASRDTYVDILRTNTQFITTFTVVYTEVVNNAASPALALNSIRLAKIVTSGAAITSVVQTGIDTLGNSVYLNDAHYTEKYFTTLGANTYTKPQGLKHVIIEVVGGGGSGAGTPATGVGQVTSSGGGGEGGYARKKILATSIGITETATIGVGGAGVAGAQGNSGGTSSFGSHCSGIGGSPGELGLVAPSGNGQMANGGVGGGATGGDINIPGGMGLGGHTGANNNNVGTGGNGGGSVFGGGGIGGVANGGGSAGTGYGGGGGTQSRSPSLAATAGFAGAPGLIIVREYF